MIFERRRYTVRAEMRNEFIRLQHVRGFDGAIGAIMARLIGYFSTVSDATENFIHLYRYDDFGDWLTRLHGLYEVPELEPYFLTVRQILSRQENDFFLPAPIAELIPLWSDDNDWLPGEGGRNWDLRENPDLVVEESTISLIPGSLPRYWGAMEEFNSVILSLPWRYILATWQAMTGRLHVVVAYEVFCSMADRDAFRTAVRDNDAKIDFDKAVHDIVIKNDSTLLRPVRVSEMSPMFMLD